MKKLLILLALIGMWGCAANYPPREMIPVFHEACLQGQCSACKLERATNDFYKSSVPYWLRPLDETLPIEMEMKSASVWAGLEQDGVFSVSEKSDYCF